MGDIITRDYVESMFDSRRVSALVNDGAGPKGTKVDDAIEAAEDEVFNLLSKQYSLEQLQADASIKRCVAVATMYMLEMRRSDISKGIQLAYDQSREYLKALIDGDAKLNSVEQLLPRITQGNAADVFESSDYFVGMPSVDDPT